MVKKKTCIFISGQGSNLKNLIIYSRDNSFPIKISLVNSNNRKAYGLIYAKKYKVPYKHENFDSDILNDLKGATKETGEPVISSFNQLIQRVGNTQLSQYVQRLYAGGDNLWKLYGHEFYISELKQFTKSIDDVKRYFNDIVGREFVEISPKTGVKKTVMEGIEEIAAH